MEILLVNLGGPRNEREIQPFLFDLFMDPMIIPIPLKGAARRVFAWIASKLRTARIRSRYAKIGGFSPLVKLTEAQGETLRRELVNRGREEMRPVVAMRYGEPSIERVWSWTGHTHHKLIVLPLFPHYCRATTGTVIEEVRRLGDSPGDDNSLVTIQRFWDEPLYCQAMCQLIQDTVSDKNLSDTNTMLLFAAHSVPQSYPLAGDPYVTQIEDSVKKIVSYIDWDTKATQLAYQSQVGPIKWVGPAVSQVLSEIRQKFKNLLVVPISFVSDHLETLYDMDIVLKAQCHQHHLSYHRVPCLNSHPTFIQCLANISLNALSSLN